MPVKKVEKKEEEPHFGEVKIQQGGKKERWSGEGTSEKPLNLTEKEKKFLLNLPTIQHRVGEGFITSAELSKLEKNGLIEFKNKEGREVEIALTDRGREEVKKIKEEQARAKEDRRGRIDREERRRREGERPPGEWPTFY